MDSVYDEIAMPPSTTYILRHLSLLRSLHNPHNLQNFQTLSLVFVTPTTDSSAWTQERNPSHPIGSRPPSLTSTKLESLIVLSHQNQTSDHRFTSWWLAQIVTSLPRFHTATSETGSDEI